jgi:hypothetical protein
MAKGIPTLKRRPRRGSGVSGPSIERALLLTLAIEMNHITSDALSRLGLSPEEQQVAAAQARKIKKREWPSARIMAAINGAGDVLSTWRRDKRYRGADGSPRVLPIRGKGATLQSLVRKCVPQMTLEEVLSYICSHGEAILYKGDRVALLGSAAVITQRTTEMTLAWMLTQFRHVADTTLHNTAVPAHLVKGTGMFQRQVAGWLSEKDFRLYTKELFPQLQELCAQLEAGLSIDRRAKPRANRKECGVGIFVYQDTGRIG